MKKTVIFMALSIFAAQTFACGVNTKSKINNAFFWMEATDINLNKAAMLDRDLELTEYATAKDVMVTKSGDYLWPSKYSTNEKLNRYLQTRLIQIGSIVPNFSEKYEGATDDFIKSFKRNSNSITYCEASQLLQAHFKH